MRSVEIDGVKIRYNDRGSGAPVVFVHGVWVGGALWHDLVDRLDGVRAIVPTWPLGAHSDPAPDADLSARAVARMIPAFLEALDLEDVTLVGNDTGGGLCLACLGSGHPGLERIGRLVLTNCDSYEHFPPKGFDTMIKVMRRSPRAGQALLRFFASRQGRRLFLRSVCAHPPSGDRAAAIFESFPTSPFSRADALRTSRTLEPSVTLDAVEALRSFDHPVLLVWGTDDELFPVEHATRLAADFRDARLTLVEGAKAFVMVDAPDEVATAILDFIEPSGS